MQKKKKVDVKSARKWVENIWIQLSKYSWRFAVKIHLKSGNHFVTNRGPFSEGKEKADLCLKIQTEIWRACFQNLLHSVQHDTHLQLRSQQSSHTTLTTNGKWQYYSLFRIELTKKFKFYHCKNCFLTNS